MCVQCGSRTGAAFGLMAAELGWSCCGRWVVPVCTGQWWQLWFRSQSPGELQNTQACPQRFEFIPSGVRPWHCFCFCCLISPDDSAWQSGVRPTPGERQAGSGSQWGKGIELGGGGRQCLSAIQRDHSGSWKGAFHYLARDLGLHPESRGEPLKGFKQANGGLSC